MCVCVCMALFSFFFLFFFLFIFLPVAVVVCMECKFTPAWAISPLLLRGHCCVFWAPNTPAQVRWDSAHASEQNSRSCGRTFWGCCLTHPWVHVGSFGWRGFGFLNQRGVQALVALLCPACNLEIQGRHFLDSATILILVHIYIYNPPYHIHSITVCYIFLNRNKLQGYS